MNCNSSDFVFRELVYHKSTLSYSLGSRPISYTRARKLLLHSLVELSLVMVCIALNQVAPLRLWCSLTYTKLEIILFSFHREIRQQNILGVELDSMLSLKEHISKRLHKVHAKSGALRRIRRIVPSNVMLRLYKSFILTHLEYCGPPCGGEERASESAGRC